jgi:LCP family protein required for cell wall assembly
MPPSYGRVAVPRLAAFARRLRTALWLVPTVAVVVFVLANVLVAMKLSSADRVDVSLADSPSGGGANYLLIGSDTRAFASDPNDVQQFGEAGGQRSDTIMVVHTDPDADHAVMVSFPRDLWVDIPGHGAAKLNAAFNYGPQSVIDTLSSNFDIPIQHYVEVNFASFRDIVDAIGTVPVYFPAPVRDEFSLLYVAFPGCVQLDGEGALAFVRSRHLELLDPATNRWRQADPIPDIGRVARQQALLRVIGGRAMDAALTNPFEANAVADAAIGDLKLDRHFGRHDVFVLADGLGGQDEHAAVTITIPTTGATRDGQSVLLTTSGADAVLAQLRSFDTVAAGPAQPSNGTPVRMGSGSGLVMAAGRTSKLSAPAGIQPPPPSPLAPVPGGC